MDVSEIKDPNSFKTWLEDKPKEWAQVLAARCALRVAPLAWSVAALSDDVLEKKHRENLTLLTFRTNFISSIALDHPTDNMKRVARAAEAATYVAYVVDAAARAATNAATNDAAAAPASAAAAAAASAAAADAADAAVAARGAASAAASAYASTDSAMASTSPAYVAASFFWDTLRADCDWLEAVAEGNDTDSAKQAQALSNKPLWIKFAAPDTLPMELEQKFHQFNESELAQTRSFGLITDWYKAAIEGKSAFGKKAELAIAKMSPEDWGDKDEERDCIAVMDRVKEIAGWGRKKPLLDSSWDFFISYNEHDEAVAKRISNILEEEGYSVFSQFNDMTVGKSFVQEMNKGLEGMGRMIAVYSPDYFSSGPCMSEWEAAYLTDSDGSKGNIVPFLVKACSPPPLARRIIWKSLQGLNSQQERTAVLAALDKADVPKTRVAMRNALKDTSSPDIVSNATDEKLDVVPNKQFDTPFVEEELLDLPEILRSLIDTLLAGVEQTNCPPTLKQALKAYSNELDARGANCILGVLRAQMDVIELGLSSEQAEYWCSDETLSGAFEKIREYHLQLITHYPLDQTRQRLVNAIDVAPEKLNGENFDDHRREIIKATADAHEAGELTDRYRDITENQLTVARDVLDVATPDFSQSDDKEFDLKERDRIARIEDAKKRRLTDVVGTADKSLEVLTKMTKLAESETAKNLLNAFKRLGDWFW